MTSTISGPHWEAFERSADRILASACTAEQPAAGVVAMVTDRDDTIYKGASGRRRIDNAAAMQVDDVFALFSTTKAITATAALQLVEDGKLDLDRPAADYAPAIGELEVLTGFDEHGDTVTRPPRTQPTTRQLLTHTAGFGYDFFDENYRRLAEEQGQSSVITATRAALTTPLLFDPGERWQYGTNVDWAGQVVEQIAGQRLGAVFAERIFAPLGIENTSFMLEERFRPQLAAMHARNADGSLSPMDFELPSPPEVDFGGHGLYGTVGDYMKFIRMWLNDGAGEYGRVLEPSTVLMAVQNHLGDLPVTMLPGVIPSLANDAEFFPGVSKSWSLPFMINNEQAPTGRPAGAQGWAGLANLFYWIDRENGVGGFWATQILPFGDPTSFGHFLEFESALYAALH